MATAQSFQILAAVATAFAAATLLIHLRSKASSTSLRIVRAVKGGNEILLLPRFFLLEALSEQVHKLPSLVPPSEWYPFVSHFTSILDRILELEDRTAAKFCDFMDKHLVSYLHSNHQLSSLVDGYLPQPGETWAQFLDNIAQQNASQQLPDEAADNDAPDDAESQDEYLRACFQLVEGMKAQIKGLRIRDTRRTTININQLPPPVGYTVQKLFYATDRQVTEDCEYLGSRKDTMALHYGSVLVGIPSEHCPGRVEAPGNKQEASPLCHVVVLGIDSTVQGSNGKFVGMLRADMLEHERLAGAGRKEVLIYIHGYNVRFKDAVKRAGQLKFDLQFQGTLVCYSWSSMGTLYGYQHDSEAIKQTVDSLASFLQLCFTELGASRLHVLAHSMGNRALIAALNKLFVAAEAPFSHPLCNVILAAADERRKYFEKLLESAAKHEAVPHFSVYCSKDDNALLASRIVNRRTALGDTRSYFNGGAAFNKNNVDIIDATGMDLNRLHHSYYGDVPELLLDIRQLLTYNYKAGERVKRNPECLIKLVRYKGKDFYAFRPKCWSS